MNVTIQPATEENIYEVLPMVKSYHEFEGIDMANEKRQTAVLKLLREKSAGGVWLVFAECKLVGYIALCTGYSIEFAGLDAFIDEFYISPDSRGQGVGERVLELIKDEARKMNIQAIHLEVARSNKKAQRLYSRAMFRAREKFVIMSVNL